MKIYFRYSVRYFPFLFFFFFTPYKFVTRKDFNKKRGSKKLNEVKSAFPEKKGKNKKRIKKGRKKNDLYR